MIGCNRTPQPNAGVPQVPIEELLAGEDPRPSICATFRAVFFSVCRVCGPVLRPSAIYFCLTFDRPKDRQLHNGPPHQQPCAGALITRSAWQNRASIGLCFMKESVMSNLPPLSIELGSEKSKPYKSIQKISWHEIPPFAVLTGLNGSGKTQFLQVLAYRLSYRAAEYQPSGQVHIDMPLSISPQIEPADVAYLPSAENAFRAGSTNISSLYQAKNQFLQSLAPQNAANNIEAQILRERVYRQFGIRVDHMQQVTQEMIDRLPNDFTYMLEYGDVSAGLSHLFVGYQVHRAELLMAGQSEDLIRAELGRPPWDFLNEALASAEFEYRIIPPENKLLKDYRVQVEAVGTKMPLELNDLSSGERTILRTMFWFYNTKHNNVFPKLFILDEPDAHLHPSMTRQFIDVLKNVLVDQYGVRVILSTHSPSTVALAPEESIFLMSREEPRIRRAGSKAEAIGLLTAGLVIVSPGTRFVLVEDEADVKYYTAVRDVLADQGPSKDPKALKPAPSIVFMPASRGKGAAKTGGGRNVVKQWVERFDAPPLNEMFRGIIDRDNGNIGGSRVEVLGRYTIENYLLDPIVVFGLLMEEKKAPAIRNVNLTPGDEHRLRTLQASSLQLVVDYIAQQVERVMGTLTADEKVTALVAFTAGVGLKYPTWMLTKPGHELLPIYQKVFGPTVITPPRLENSLRRVRLIPNELAEIMARLQAI
jgi:predicted ATPase